MSPLPWSLRLLELCAAASAAALELLVQSTLVIALGLTAAWLLRGRGSALRSAIYRATLVAVVACPAATWLISALGLSAAIDWLPSLRPTVVKLVQPASDPSNVGRSDVAVQNEALSDATAQLSGAAARQADPFPSSRVGEPFGNSPRFSDVPLDESPGVRRESSGDRRAQSIRKDGIAAVKAVPAQPAGPAWVVNPAAAVLAIGVAAFWLLGSSVLFLRLLIDHFRVIAICRTASPADADDRLLRDELAAKLGISAPHLLRSPYLSGPCSTGLWRHTILLPEESSDVPLSSVLIHELAHLRRGDSRWNLLRHAVRAVLFFQPLLWRLSRRMEEAAEEVCDDHVVHWGADRSVYANGLVRLAEQRSLPLSTVVPLVRFRSLLGRRVQRILDRSHRLSLRAGMKALCAIAAAGLAVTLVVALLAPSGRSASAPPPSEPKKSDEGADNDAADAATAAETPNDAKRLSGMVLLPNGKPATEAHVVVIGELRQGHRTLDFAADQSVVVAHRTCDAAGKFEIQATGLSSQRYLRLHLLVRSAESGLAWREVNPDDSDSNFYIELPEESEARGRLVTLEGQPAGGVRVTVLGVQPSGTRDSGLYAGVYVGDVAPPEVWPSGVISDADGGFTVRGMAANVDIGLYINQEPYAPERLSFDRMGIGASKHVFALSPAQIIKGVVVAADTSKPLANAIIHANQNWEGDLNRGMMPVEGKSDAEGRFAVNPYAARAYTVTVAGPEGTPYLAKEIEFKWSDTEREHELRIELPRGVLIRGTIVEEPSGQPVAKATVRYSARRNNPHAIDVPLSGVYRPTELTDAQGRFSIAVPAGAGHLTVKSAAGEHVLKELDARQITEGRRGWQRLYVNADAAIDLADDAREETVQFKVYRGMTVEGQSVRSDGQLPKRIIMLHRGLMQPHGDEFWMYDPTTLTGNRFEVRGVPPEGNLPVFLLDPDAKEGKRLALRGGDAGKPLRVELEPCGSLTMRFLDPDGKPLAGHSPTLMMVFTPGKPRYDFANDAEISRADETYIQNFDRVNDWDPMSDETGRVTFPTLMAGVTYQLWEIADKDQQQQPKKYREITVKPGEHLTLPDIIIRNPDVLQRAEEDWTKKQKLQAMKAATPSAANSGESPKQMPTGTFSTVQAPIVEKAMSSADRTSKPPSASRNDSTRFVRTADDDLIRVNGRVLDPQGKPVAGADVAAVEPLWKVKHDSLLVAAAKSDNAGRFNLEFRKSQFTAGRGEAWRSAIIVASMPAARYGMTWLDFDSIKPNQETTLQLAPDEPIEGRIVDLEGRPLAEVEARIGDISTNAKGDLTTWLGALHDGIPFFGSESYDWPDRFLYTEFVGRWAAKTDADGRFRLSGVGHDRVATIYISGGGVAAADLKVVTRPMAPFKVDMSSRADSPDSTTYYGSHLQYAAEPAQPIEGIVRDAKTRQPLAGVRVVSHKFAGGALSGLHWIDTVSDDSGGFRLKGMPKGEGNKIMAIPADNQPYFQREFDVPTAAGLEPVKFDLELHRGVPIHGRVTDKSSGAPVEGARMHFIPWPDNPNLAGLAEFGHGWVHGSQMRYLTDHDGRYALVGLPGRGLVEVDCPTQPFPPGQGLREITDLPTPQQFMKVAGALTPSANFTTAVKETHIGEQDVDVLADIELDPGKRLTLNIVDPNGKPLTGVEVQGLWPSRQSRTQHDAGPTVEVIALSPDENRIIRLYQKERNLGEVRSVCWKDDGAGPVTVKLELCATLKARLVDKNGDPVRGGRIGIQAQGVDSRTLSDMAATDRDGRLNYTRLLPRGKYSVSCDCAQVGLRLVAKDLAVSPGEIIDLGEFDVTSKDRPKPNRTNAVSSEIESKTTVPADGKREMKSPAAAGRSDSTQSDRKADDDLLSVRGRVLDPQGRPMAGADVAAVQDYFTAWSHTSVPLVTTKSDEAGQFHLEFRQSEIVQSDEPLRRVSIVAKSFDSKFGIAWIQCDAIKPGEETTLQLVADEPVEGRIVDLEGRPIAGVEVRVNELWTNAKGDLTAWLAAQRSGVPSVNGQDLDIPDRSLATEFANEWKTKTDADGRFRLTGLGHDRMADILVSGHGTAAALRVVARPMEPITVDATRRSVVPQLNIYYGSHFQYAVEPSQPIVGVVRDAKTGRPLAGVQVVSDKLAGRFSGILSWTTRDTVSDAKGNYRLEGLPKGEGNQIVAIPADGEPYFMRSFDVPTAPGFEPIKLDLELHRGVLIQGRVSDKATGAPVAGARMFFVPWPDNPNADDVADMSRGHWREDVGGRYQTDRDGRYTLVGVPGRGLVEVAHVLLPRVYPPGQGLREIADLPSPRDFFRVAGSQDPPDPKRTVAAKELHIGQQDVQVQADFELESGKQLSLNVVDPEGKPLPDVKVSGDLPREYAWRQIAAGPRIDVMALWPEEERRMVLYQKERNLGKLFRVCWNKDGPGPVVVRLEPCATLKARLLDKYGDPVQGASLRFAEVGRMDSFLAMPRGATDRGGRLNYTALVPGARYTVYCDAGPGSLQTIATDLSVSPGEVIDLGEFDVTSKERPKPVRSIAVDSKIQSKTTAPADGKDEMKSPAAAREMRKQP